MDALFFKNKVKYINGDLAKSFCYYKIQADGKFLVISLSKNTLSSPKSIVIKNTFEPIKESEFNKKLKALGFSNVL